MTGVTYFVHQVLVYFLRNDPSSTYEASIQSSATNPLLRNEIEYCEKISRIIAISWIAFVMRFVSL